MIDNNHPSFSLLHVLLIIASLSFIYYPHTSHSLEPADVNDASQRAEELAADGINTENKHESEAEKRARKLYEAQYADKLKEARQWQDRMSYDGEKIIIRDDPTQRDPQHQLAETKFLSRDERIYIFISSSMPVSTLRNYAEAIDKIGDPNVVMVIRGCVNGCRKLQPTLEFISSILKKSEDDAYHVEVNIDPMLFRLYKIEQVPVTIYAQGVKTDIPSMSEGLESNLKSMPDAVSVIGDVGLDYALEKIHNKTKREPIRLIMAELKRGFYDR